MYGDSLVKDKTVSRDHLIFNMGVPILVRQHLYIETAPWQWCKISSVILSNVNLSVKMILSRKAKET